MKRILFLITAISFLTACAAPNDAAESLPVSEPVLTPLSTQIPSNSPTAISPTSIAPIATTSPLYPYSFEYLTTRSYGEGEIKIISDLGGDKFFSRLLFSYPSDGLKIYGFMDVPRQPGLYPAVIALHGHVNADVYQTLDYTTRYADAIAHNGYVVIHPNMRNYKPSDSGPSDLYVGYAIDVLNLIHLVRKEGNQVGPLKQADPQKIGLWGHSMGGGIALRVATLDSSIRSVVLYGAVSGDLTQSIGRFDSLSSNPLLLNVSRADLLSISPSSFYANIQAAISIHHGENDPTVPPQWSKDLYDQLTLLHKNVECFFYSGQVHTFQGDGEQLFEHRVVDFFSRTLR